MPEKSTPHHDLNAFKAAATRIGVTTKALSDATALGFSRSEISTVIGTMTGSHFYKAMTSHENNKEWQDVYRVPHGNDELYVKFRDDAVLEFKLLSFKER